MNSYDLVQTVNQHPSFPRGPFTSKEQSARQSVSPACISYLPFFLSAPENLTAWNIPDSIYRTWGLAFALVSLLYLYYHPNCRTGIVLVDNLFVIYSTAG